MLEFPSPLNCLARSLKGIINANNPIPTNVATSPDFSLILPIIAMKTFFKVCEYTIE